MIRENLARKVKKTSILFEKEKIKSQLSFQEQLANIFLDEDCKWINSQELIACRDKIRKNQLIWRSLKKNKNERFVELDELGCKQLIDVRLQPEVEDKDVLVIPLEWELLGGFIVPFNKLILNLADVIYLSDNDFDLFDSTLKNQLSLRAETCELNLIKVEITTQGEGFDSMTSFNDV